VRVPRLVTRARGLIWSLAVVISICGTVPQGQLREGDGGIAPGGNSVVLGPPSKPAKARCARAWQEERKEVWSEARAGAPGQAGDQRKGQLRSSKLMDLGWALC